MKRLLILVFLFIAVFLTAQATDPFSSIRHSSVDTNGNVHLRWNNVDAIAGGSLCFYRIGTGAWISVTPTVTDPVTMEMEALIPYSFGQRMRYRLQYGVQTAEGDVSILHAAYSDADSFPMNLNNMALICTDPAGDLVAGTNTNLDVRETYVAATATKIYFSMKNATGAFPTMNSIFSYNAYMCGIANIESAITDSIAYAMIYATVPVLLTNGLYKIGYDAATSLPTFTRLGNIQAQVSGGTLHLACNISDLVNDPAFGNWPNSINGLGIAASTLSLTVSPTLAVDAGDYSLPAGVIFVDNVYEVAVNHPPQVMTTNYDPELELLYFTYTDEDNDFPLIAEVETPDGTIIQAYSLDFSFQNATFAAAIPATTHGYSAWRFSDNGTSMVTGFYSIYTATEDDVMLPAPITCQMPNPFKTNSTIALKGLSNTPLKVTVFNLRGQNLGDIYTGVPKSTELSFSWDSKLASGIYFLRIEQDKRVINHRFVITK